MKNCILYIVDDNVDANKLLYISLSSLVQSNQNIDSDIAVITTKKNHMMHEIEKRLPCEINVMFLDDNKDAIGALQQLNTPSFGIANNSKFAFIRLLIPYFKQLDVYSRILYLDIDTIINKSIQPFFDFDFADGVVFYGCPESMCHKSAQQTKKLLNYIESKLSNAGYSRKNEKYINAGVIAINYNAKNKQRLLQSVDEEIDMYNKCNLMLFDQDIINTMFSVDYLPEGFVSIEQNHLPGNEIITHFVGKNKQRILSKAFLLNDDFTQKKLSIFVSYHSDESTSEKYTSFLNRLDEMYPNVYKQIFGGYSFYSGSNQLVHNMLHDTSDDPGKTISQYGKNLNELTNIYWVYKNYELVGNPNYVGFCHYRRIIDIGKVDLNLLDQDKKNLLCLNGNVRNFVNYLFRWHVLNCNRKESTPGYRLADIEKNVVYPDWLKKELHNLIREAKNTHKDVFPMKYICIMRKELFFELMKHMEKFIERCIQHIDLNKKYESPRQCGYLCEFFSGVISHLLKKQGVLNLVNVKDSLKIIY